MKFKILDMKIEVIKHDSGWLNSVMNNTFGFMFLLPMQLLKSLWTSVCMISKAVFALAVTLLATAATFIGIYCIGATAIMILGLFGIQVRLTDESNDAPATK